MKLSLHCEIEERREIGPCRCIWNSISRFIKVPVIPALAERYYHRCYYYGVQARRITIAVRAHKAMSSNDCNFKLAYMTGGLINPLTVSKFTLTRQSTQCLY